MSKLLPARLIDPLQSGLILCSSPAFSLLHIRAPIDFEGNLPYTYGIWFVFNKIKILEYTLKSKLKC